MFFFFFSSRRRHTRYWRDWSSDVCSSDLAGGRIDLIVDRLQSARRQLVLQVAVPGFHLQVLPCAHLVENGRQLILGQRSEERRVGKECRSRWWRHAQQKNRMYEDAAYNAS